MTVMLWAERWRIAVGKGMTVLAVGAAVLTLAACGGAGKPATRTYTIHGTVRMVGGDLLPADCRMEGMMQGYYSDLREGAKIVVKDLSGAVLATTALSATTPSPALCVWTFEAHVPAAEFYMVTSPNGGEVGVSFSQLEKDSWSLQVSTDLFAGHG